MSHIEQRVDLSETLFAQEPAFEALWYSLICIGLLPLRI
jgi:hypothetical protein